MEISDDAFNKLVIYGERYTLGRMTYAVSDYIDIVTPHISELQDSTLKCLIADFYDCDNKAKRYAAYREAEKQDAAKHGMTISRPILSPWGMEQDEKHWRALWAKCHNELADRNEKRQA